MSEQRHTPGPWKAHATGLARSGKPEFEIHWSDDGECVAEIVHGEADANLITAAPDLLAALKRLLPALGDEPDGIVYDPELEDRVVFARAAIAKATGETK